MAKPMIVNAPPPRPPFEWLAGKRNRRSNLRAVRTAIRRGWLDEATPEHRVALIETLGALLDDDLKPRELFAVFRILLTMDAANLESDRARLKLARRARRAQRPQSPGRKRG